MYQRKLEPDIRCPLEYGLEIFGGCGAGEHAQSAAGERHRVPEVLRRDTAARGVFAERERSVGGADIAEHLCMVGRVLQGRPGECDGAVSEV